jgi:GNAT superfamily N-acetyltransferase
MIRLATLNDVPSWLEIVLEVETLFGAMADFEVHARRAIHRGTAIVAPAAGSVLGAALLSRDDQPHSINWLSVRANARRCGVGGRLLTAIAERWSTGDIAVIIFGADIPVGQPARRLYERHGFINRGPTQRGADGGSRDVFVLER